MDLNNLLLTSIQAAIEAGQAIMEIYQTDFTVEHKADDSPLTLADKQSHNAIVKFLRKTDIPILSEEGKTIPYADRNQWETLWIVDPLDGTKEFIKRNDEFTVNIALVQHKEPVMGVIFIPVKKTLFFAEKTIGSYKLEDAATIDQIYESVKATDLTLTLEAIIEKSHRLPLSAPSQSPYTIVGSRSHATPELEAFVEEKRSQFDQVDFISAGSSLKFCLVAEGKAAIYPRLGPTMEWDTAAGQAIAVCAGATVYRHDTGDPLAYNREDLLNPYFIVEMTPAFGG
jgi:3'(2'), 5'-bisphosphate nucleotidase